MNGGFNEHGGAFVSIPFPFLEKYLPFAKNLGLGVELALSWRALENGSEKVIDALLKEKENGMEFTFHAPFGDIAPGASDPMVREATLERYRQTAALAEKLEPKVIVVHSGYDENRYWMDEDGFINRSVDTWNALLEMTEKTGCAIALENVFEPAAGVMAEVIKQTGSERFGACFDAGHFNLFSKHGLDHWLDALDGSIFELHLHNNHGERDDHFGMTDGKFDFDSFFDQLFSRGADPVMTFEAHTEKGVMESVKYLEGLMTRKKAGYKAAS